MAVEALVFEAHAATAGDLLRTVALHLNAKRLRVFLAKHTLQNALGDFGHQFAASQNVENLRACATEVDLLRLHEIAVLHR